MASGESPVSYIRDIWCDTLDAEMATIREIVTSYPYVSMVLLPARTRLPLPHCHPLLSTPSLGFPRTRAFRRPLTLPKMNFSHLLYRSIAFTKSSS